MHEICPRDVSRAKPGFDIMFNAGKKKSNLYLRIIRGSQEEDENILQDIFAGLMCMLEMVALESIVQSMDFGQLVH